MADRRAPASTRVAVWGGVAAAILIALGAGAAVLRSGGAAERACDESGGIWNYEQRVCEEPHGGPSEGR